MFYPTMLSGTSLPPKTLCLTFDDGPGSTDGDGVGPHTLELAQYLNSQGIQATFFEVGRHATLYPDIVAQVQSLGHLVGNHTLEHPDLVAYLSSGNDPFTQVAYTDDYIRKGTDGSTVYFRPPYGSWSADVAQALNQNLAICRDHVGPILWDINGSDWQAWQNGVSVQDCLQTYLDLITATPRGIVLMHDSNWDPTILPKVNTYALIQLLVPILQGQGYQFVRLDAIPDVQAAAQAPVQFSLQAANATYVSVQGNGSGQTLVNSPAIGPTETFTIENLEYDKVAIKCSNGLYLSPQGGGGDGQEVIANGPDISVWERLEIVTVGRGKIAFQTVNGFFLSRENVDNGRLMANSPWVRENEVFTFQIAGS
jgi:peptidoglycan/xylan/chitin deacetylase (PgdA/CDA1 family)